MKTNQTTSNETQNVIESISGEHGSNKKTEAYYLASEIGLKFSAKRIYKPFKDGMSTTDEKLINGYSLNKLDHVETINAILNGGEVRSGNFVYIQGGVINKKDGVYEISVDIFGEDTNGEAIVYIDKNFKIVKHKKISNHY